MPKLIDSPKRIQVDPFESETEKVKPPDPRAGLIWCDIERMSGAPCFTHSRVPIQHLWDYLEGGDTLEEFLDDFEGVSREQVIAVLEMAKQRLLEGLAKG